MYEWGLISIQIFRHLIIYKFIHSLGIAFISLENSKYMCDFLRNVFLIFSVLIWPSVHMILKMSERAQRWKFSDFPLNCTRGTPCWNTDSLSFEMILLFQNLFLLIAFLLSALCGRFFIYSTELSTKWPIVLFSLWLSPTIVLDQYIQIGFPAIVSRNLRNSHGKILIW